jgi:hypothetical protein
MEKMQKSFKETKEYQIGNQGELKVVEMLQKRGWFVIPSYDYSGDDGNKAPKLQGLCKNLVIPDLDISKNGSRKWAEVKTKNAATYTRITNRYEHGIPLRHFEHYRDVEQITGCEVWLFIFELDTGQVLFQKLCELEKSKRIYDGGKMSWGGMIFFQRDKFKKFDIDYQLLSQPLPPGRFEE